MSQRNLKLQQERQEHLERGWDSQVTNLAPPSHAWKGNITPDVNLKNLVLKKKLPAVQSAKTLPTRTSVDSTCSTTPSAFNSIAATFGFSHHVGTDKGLELQVLREILKRESALANLEETCVPKYSNKIFLQTETGTGVLDHLTQIREITVAVIEAISSWRQSMVNADPLIPRPFIFENQNYLLKVTNDMDFLANIKPLVEALGLTNEKLRSNPLMMPSPLDCTNVDREPADAARQDAEGETNSKTYLERLRLRTAEQVLLRELSFNRKGAPSVAWEDEKTVKTLDTSNKETATLLTQSTDDTKARQADILGWYRQAQLQLLKLEEGIGENLSTEHNSTSRLRVPVPEEEPLIRVSSSPPKLLDPTTLYEYHSTAADVPLGSRSRSPSPTQSRGGMRRLRRLPEQDSARLVISNLAPALEWTREDIRVLLNIENAPRCLALASASTLILLATGPQVPKNISWETFCMYAKTTPIDEYMNDIIPSQIPPFKIRAINPFLGSLGECFEEELKSEDPETSLESGVTAEIIKKLVDWVKEVLRIATTDTPAAPFRTSSSQSTIETIKTRRLESNMGMRRKIALEKCKPRADMKVKHSETVENELLEGSTLTISLEVQKKKPSPANPKRFNVKVFDEKTFQFAESPINCKEFSNYFLDLQEAFPGDDLSECFDPTSSKWWASHIKDVVSVSSVQGSLNIKVSKKNIRSLVSSHMKSKNKSDDGDLVKQDDEMDLQQPLKKEKDTGKEKKGRKGLISGYSKRKEAAAAAAKAKELERKRQEEEEKQKKASAKRKAEQQRLAAKKKAEEAKRKEDEEKKAMAEKKKRNNEAANKEKSAIMKTEVDCGERAEEKRDPPLATVTGKDSDNDAAALNTREKDEPHSRHSDDVAGVYGAEKENENGLPNDTDSAAEYDAEYDDEQFVMSPKKSPASNQKEEKANKDSGDDDTYGDDYEDENYDDDSFTKTMGESLSKTPKKTDQVAHEDSKVSNDDYTLSDDDYEAEFDEE